MKCPHCESNLRSSQHNRYFAYACDNCQGIWIPGNEIVKITNKEPAFSFDKGKPYSDSIFSGSSDRTCPSCRNTPLFIRHLQGIELDICAGCGGIYFDHDEIEKLIQSDGDKEWFDAAAIVDIVINLLTLGMWR